MTLILAYSDQISVAPGDTLNFMVSCEGAASYRVDIVRLICCDTGPDGAGFKEEEVETRANGTYPGRKQDIQIGSYGVVPGPAPFNALESFTVQAMIWPTRPGKGRQALLGTWSARNESGFGMCLDEDGALALVLGDGKGGVETVATGRPVAERRWSFVAASFEAATRKVRLYQEPLAGHDFSPDAATGAEATSACVPGPGPGPLLFAAWHRGGDAGRMLVGGHFSGKIDRPRLANRALNRAEMAALAARSIPAGLEGTVVGAWDFSCDISSERITDLSPNALDGETVNLPTRAVTGFNWTGEEMNWHRAPEQYGAIHFHEDDLYDAGWEADFSLIVPEGIRSGVYAARLRADGFEAYAPFFVRPPRGKGTAEVVFLGATATYMAYANQRVRLTGALYELVQGRLTVVDATDLLMLDHPELGLSAYDVHSDGSGVCYSSRLRPLTNFRPKGRIWNFAADLMIIDWLEHTGLGYDVITDEDLHHDGLKALENYRVVVTSGHPEYCSREMLDALDGFLRRGGRLMYLGGNGFYWRIAYHRQKPGVIEVRRGESGIRAWEGGVGEGSHSFTGEYGGIWRRQARPPNLLVGVGFFAEGFDASSYYRRQPASRDARAAFIFEGIGDGDIIGDFGILRDGAAGLELDRYGRRLGSPRHALVLASSENHSNIFEIVNDEVLVPHGATDGVQSAEIRADMVFFECPNGGAVFSTGSIAYAGSLSHNGYDNDVACLTTNVLKRFIDDTPFEMSNEAAPARN